MLSCLFQKKSTLLVFCEEGIVVEIDSPEGAKFDTSHTFHITGLPMRQYKFKSIKSRLRVSITYHSLVTMDVDVNEHEKLYNFTPRQKLLNKKKHHF